MRFSEWIKAQLDALQAIVSSDGDDSAESAALRIPIQEKRTAEKLDIKFKSDPANVSQVRRSIESFCEEAGLDAPARDEVGLVVNEAIANIIRHAYHGDKTKPIQATVERQPDGVKISLRDWGNGVDPDALPPREHDPLIPGGLGLICIRRLMDQADYEPQKDGMKLVMTRSTLGSRALKNDKSPFP